MAYLIDVPVADALGVGVRGAALAEADGVLAAVHLVDGD